MGKNTSYFSDATEFKGKLKKDSGRRSEKSLDTHILQFIFDRVKANDSLNLNEIYSHAKKIKQFKRDGKDYENVKQDLQEAMTDSQLPDDLKTKSDFNTDDLFADGTFLHLVCKYYKLRQRAKDGRIFIHPEYQYIKGRGYENTGRFDDRGHLLTYCNHKPRQKRYQMLYDIAGVLQVSPKKLKRYLQSQDKQAIDEKIVSWLKNVSGLKVNCERASKEQKERRGILKLDIQRIYGLIYHKTKEGQLSSDLSNSKKKEVLESSKVDDAYRLYKFCDNAKGLCKRITQDLYDEKQQKKWQEDLEKNPASAIYFLAQINNIAFKERGGNAKTCAVCSLDNAQRMVQVPLENSKEETTAKAQRLPAIETRIIDGAVMRLARIVGNAIAKDKWEVIKGELQKGHKVHIPIITESNRFEFEPSLTNLKGKDKKQDKKNKKDKKSKTQEDIYQSKEERIKDVGQKICPYTGDSLGDNGEIDHIIPRTSIYGTLNDEANLIYASKEGNKQKGNHKYSLSNLNSQYKQKVFKTTDHNKIRGWIIDQIGDGTDEDFKFGKYRSFINLTPEEQKAFRYALFLVGHPLHEKVIKAIGHRGKAFVNGTQRYFAQVLANNLYKKAKEIKKQDLLSFDYFGVQAQSSTRGDGIYDLRQRYEECDTEFFEKYKKQIGQSQKLYSHLIDAQLAFAMVADQHKKEGSLKLKIDNGISLWPIDKNTGEVFKNILFYKIKVSEEDINESLERRKPNKDFFAHKTLFDSNPCAWHFLHLIEIIAINKKGEKNIQYLKGFLSINNLKDCLKNDDWLNKIQESYKNYASLFKHNTGGRKAVGLYSVDNGQYNFGYKQKEIIKNQKIGQSHFTIYLSSINKEKVAEFLFKNFNTKSDPNNWKKEDCDVFNQLKKLWYFTKRKNLITKNKPDFSYGSLKMAGFLNPSLIKAWEDLKIKWEKKKNKYQGDVCQFLKEHFSITDNQQNHKKTRKDFSLPQLAKGQGFMLIKRKSWNKKFIYQCQSEKSGEGGVGLYYKRQLNGILYDSLTPFFRKNNIVLLKKLKDIKKHLSKEGNMISDDTWHSLNIPEQFKDIIKSIENRHKSKSDSTWRITFKNTPTIENLIDIMYGGYHIDDLKVGSKNEEKKRIKKEAKHFFKDEIQTSIDNSNILEIKELLKKKQQNLVSQINDKQKNNENSQIIKELQDRKEFITRWINCCTALKENVLEYKRGVPVKIENVKQGKR